MTDTAIGINTYVEPRHDDYPYMRAAACRRALIILSDGRQGRLFYWSKETIRARILLAGRHYDIDKPDIILVAVEGQGPDDPF